MYKRAIGVAPLLIMVSLFSVVFFLKLMEGAQEPIKSIDLKSNTAINSHLQLKKAEQVPIPEGYTTYVVSDELQLWDALNNIKSNSGNSVVIFEDGIYMLKKTIKIDVPNVMFLSRSTDPNMVILSGNGMRATKNVDNLIRVSASGFVLDGLTLRAAGNHLIQIAAEDNADRPVIRNCVLQDAYEQLLKVSYDKSKPANVSDAGLIEYCQFEYTAGIGPNYYIGGVDAHGINRWVIRYNLFKDIASPAERIAEHAIHIWGGSTDNLVEGNVIIDSDRGIGFGMRLNHSNAKPSNFRGIIKNNIIYHTDNGDLFADTGIILEDSLGTTIVGNWVYLAHDYPRAIEYRYSITRNIIIKNNQVNKSISSRNLAQAYVKGNKWIQQKTLFMTQLNEHM